MHRRASASIVLAALLLAGSGCDLPGGTPPVIGTDRSPNDTIEGAPLVRVPSTLRGTLDPDDTEDWYEVGGAVGVTVELDCTDSRLGLSYVVVQGGGRNAGASSCKDGPLRISAGADEVLYVGIYADQRPVPGLIPYAVPLSVATSG